MHNQYVPNLHVPQIEPVRHIKSFKLQTYIHAILDLSDKISAGGWWIPKYYFFTPLKSDNARTS